MLQADSSLRGSHSFGGFLSWRGFPANLKNLEGLLHGEAEAHEISEDDRFVIGIAEPAIRHAVFDLFKSRGARFMTLRHPWAGISPAASIGEANIFQRASTVFCDVTVGNANYLNGAVNLSHDVVLRDFNFVGPFSLFLGGSRAGEENMIATQCTLLPKARIGNRNILAPGSFVYKGCRDNCRLAGNAALNLRPEKQADWLALLEARQDFESRLFLHSDSLHRHHRHRLEDECGLLAQAACGEKEKMRQRRKQHSARLCALWKKLQRQQGAA